MGFPSRFRVFLNQRAGELRDKGLKAGLRIEDVASWFEFLARMEKKAIKGYMAYLKATGERLTELRGLDIYELQELFQITREHEKARQEARERAAQRNKDR